MSVNMICTHGAVMPKRNTPLDSGLDLCAKGFRYVSKYDGVIEKWFDEIDTTKDDRKWFDTNWFELHPGERVLIKTGIQIQLPEPSVPTAYGRYIIEAQVRCRSGLALKEGIMVVNGIGTIDNQYRNDVGVILYNSGKFAFTIKDGDRIAQLVFNTVWVPNEITLVEKFEEGNNDRGMDGFGSSGVK